MIPHRVRSLILAGAAGLLLAACDSLTQDEASLRSLATSTATIDFEAGLTGGDIVDTLSDGTGITVSGDAIAGTVGVQGTVPDDRYLGPAPKPANLAMIFDATCDGGTAADCTGDDTNLYQPAQGNVLILSEDGNAADPDDALGGEFEIDFSAFGPGVVTIEALKVLDVEADEAPNGFVRLFDAAGDEITTLAMITTGDGGIGTLTVGVEGVAAMTVRPGGSGAIDDVEISVTTPPDENGGGEGCTPGYWRNHAGVGPGPQANAWPTAFDPTTSTFEEAFDRVIEITARPLGTTGGRPGTLSDPLLIEALTAQGGDINALARHGTAALLNAASPDVDAAFDEAEVVAMVQDAIDGTRSLQDVHATLEEANELGCPL